jgi:hypothetical protein
MVDFAQIGAPSMSYASRAAHLGDLIDDLTGLYLAQVADLRQFAQTTEAGEATDASRTDPALPGNPPRRSLPAVRASCLLPTVARGRA